MRLLVVCATLASLLLPALDLWTGPSLASAASTDEWTQDGHDAQRSGAAVEEPAEPWTLAWTWNGPDFP